MLNHRCRKILKILNSTHPTYFKYGFSKADICRLSGLTEYDVLSCMFLLKRNGYVDYIREDNGPVSGYWLTEEGKFYRVFAFKNTALYILKYILAPVIVALLTTLVTLYVTAPTGASLSQPQQPPQSLQSSDGVRH